MTENQDKICSKCGKPLLNPETQNLGICADCLRLEQPSLPAPECKKREILHLDIDLEDLFTKTQMSPTPENQTMWNSPKDMSEDYIKLSRELSILATYIAKGCNEGPEVKDNINKRLALVAIILRAIFGNLEITGYDAYGLLTELTQDTYMRISGIGHVMGALSQVSQMRKEIAREKSKSYTT
jgi:hypothetical protein